MLTATSVLSMYLPVVLIAIILDVFATLLPFLVGTRMELPLNSLDHYSTKKDSAKFLDTAKTLFENIETL